MNTKEHTGNNEIRTFQHLVEIVKTLRKECPWDREQTFNSLRPHIIEEAHELAEAVGGAESSDICEECGDLLLQVLLLSEIATEQNHFTLNNVMDQLAQKLIRRHPHVFGTALAEDSATVGKNWESIKADEREGKKKKGALSGVPKTLPALLRAHKVQEVAAKKGFDWKEGDFSPVRDKILEELDELQEALQSKGPDAIREEAGDLLFAVVNFTRRAGVDSEFALQEACRKFQNRFELVEKQVEDSGTEWSSHTLEQLDVYWEQAKSALTSHEGS